MPSETYLNTIRELENTTEPFIDPRLLGMQLKLGSISLEEAREIYETYIEQLSAQLKKSIENNSNDSKKLRNIFNTIRRIFNQDMLREKEAFELMSLIEEKINQLT